MEDIRTALAQPYSDPTEERRLGYLKGLEDCAHAALAQPVGEGLTDEELLGCMIKAAASVPGGQCTGILDWDKEAIAAARAVIAADRARYARLVKYLYQEHAELLQSHRSLRKEHFCNRVQGARDKPGRP
jgi:hypothetical protein